MFPKLFKMWNAHTMLTMYNNWTYTKQFNLVYMYINSNLDLSAFQKKIKVQEFDLLGKTWRHSSPISAGVCQTQDFVFAINPKILDFVEFSEDINKITIHVTLHIDRWCTTGVIRSMVFEWFFRWSHGRALIKASFRQFSINPSKIPEINICNRRFLQILSDITRNNGQLIKKLWLVGCCNRRHSGLLNYGFVSRWPRELFLLLYEDQRIM